MKRRGGLKSGLGYIETATSTVVIVAPMQTTLYFSFAAHDCGSKGDLAPGGGGRAVKVTRATASRAGGDRGRSRAATTGGHDRGYP